MTVFIEPRLESGFPDIVFVTWCKARTRSWLPERLNLKAEDIRVLHALATMGESCGNVLEQFFGKGVRIRLERLHDAKVVSFKRGFWKSAPLKSIFAVQSIVAVEAKVDDFNDGLHQALVNTWFASRSYLLIPHPPRTDRIKKQAAAFGIGLWSKKVGLIQKPISAPVPRSYASWLFNEWVWRAEEYNIR